MEILNKVKIKPLSANEAWKGRRFKSDKYKSYQEALMILLPKKIVVPEGKLMLTLVFGFSNEANDIDNAIKQTQDILCSKYGFDDRRIYALRVVKIIVPKGEEYIAFSIESVSEEQYQEGVKEILAMIR